MRDRDETGAADRGNGEPGAPDRATDAVTDETRALSPTSMSPTLFDLVGHSIAAAHASSVASVAQLNVALAAYRLLQIQRASLSGDGALLQELLSGAEGSSEALRRLLHRDAGGGTGGKPNPPRTFNERRPGTGTEPVDSASTRGE